MSVALDEREDTVGSPPAEVRRATVVFPPRVPPVSWPATTCGGDEVLARLTSPPFVPARTDRRRRRVIGAELMLA
jgi:hypothetical protein